MRVAAIRLKDRGGRQQSGFNGGAYAFATLSASQAGGIAYQHYAIADQFTLRMLVEQIGMAFEVRFDVCGYASRPR